MAFVRADLLPIAFSSLRQAQENQDGRGQGRASPEGSAMGLTSMVNIYCPACHISSPREPRELSQLRSFCTVCGAPLNETVVEAAVARRTNATGPDTIDSQSVLIGQDANNRPQGCEE
jgi:hypothetical protein